MAKVRTQVYLEKEQKIELKLLANTSGKNFSQLIREGIGLAIKKNQKKRKKKFGEGFIGAAKGKGPTDISTKIDYHLYDEPYSDIKK